MKFLDLAKVTIRSGSGGGGAERGERGVEVLQRLLLHSQPLLDLLELGVQRDEVLVLLVHVGADGHLGVLEQLDRPHGRELAHLVLRQELQRVCPLHTSAATDCS